MKTNVLNAGYAPTTRINIAGRVSNGITALRAKADATVKNLFRALDCPIETEADRHYMKCLFSCFLSLMFPPMLIVAAYQMFNAKEKEGGKR